MEKKGFSQEALKLIACAAMLLDHIGAVFLPGAGLRIVGRIAFPIFCFLLVEGAAHTRSTKKYGRRLFLGALLSELPYDFLFYGEITWEHQSVMVTLLLGLIMIHWMRKRKWGILSFCLCFFAAEFANADYGCWGIALISLFTFTAEKSREKLLQVIGMALIFWLMGSYCVALGPVQIPIQLFGLLSMVPIGLYTGRKRSTNRAVQWGFYLFYPVHLAVLLMIKG